MSQRRFEVGLVSADRALADFFAEVFEFEPLPPIEAGSGTVHYLQAPGAVLKVMVPLVAPIAPTRAESFIGMTGIQYLTIGVDDLEGVLGRATARGARITYGPTDIEAGGRLAVLEDPDGNTIEVVEQSS